MHLHEDLPEHSVWHCAPSATSVTLDPALHLLMPPPPHLTTTLLTHPLQPLPALPQVHPVLTGQALLPMISVLTLCFLIGCLCFALAAACFALAGAERLVLILWDNSSCCLQIPAVCHQHGTAWHSMHKLWHSMAQHAITPLSRHQVAQLSLPYNLCNCLYDRQIVTSLVWHINYS